MKLPALPLAQCLHGGETDARSLEYANIVRRQLELLGEDATREGLVRTPERVAEAMRFLTRGYTQQAQKFEEKARKEIEELKSGVERAAESVLGDEAEALRSLSSSRPLPRRNIYGRRRRSESAPR